MICKNTTATINHNYIGMKLKTLLAGLLATFMLQHTVLSQTNAATTSAAADPNAPAAVADDAATNAPAPVATDPATASIPLIQFQDVPLTTAIENLARQANINYLLDPKIAYGQPDATGQVKVEPNLSIRWENITAENALIALLDNYDLQLVEDVRTKIYRVTAKDPAALPPLSTRVIHLNYASTTNMMDSIQATFTDKRSRVFPDTRTSQLIVVATDPEQVAVDQLVAQLDTPTKQVLIETRLVEISSNPTSRKGIDWTGTLSGQNVSFGNNSEYFSPPTPATPPTATTVNGVTTQSGGQPAQPGLVNGVLGTPGILGNTTQAGFGWGTGFLNADGAHAVMSFLNSSLDAQVTSTPRVVTLDNETATISVLRTYPILETTAGTQGSPGGSSITYSNVGTILMVTPRISANNTIRLTVSPIVSTFFGYLTLTASGGTSQAPQFDTRTMDTQVLIPNANTLVMGGLVDDNPEDTSTKVPLLGDIPGLGWAFRSESKVGDKKNLLIFITPTILADTDFHPTTTDFLNAQPEKREESLNPNSVWDSTRPHDWADPSNTDPDQKILNQPATQ
jgi:type II secretory pathway component GspD/PulD (secretin)